MRNTMNNFKEIGKDGKCILKGLKGIGLGLLNGAKHIIKIPVCLIQDGRDAYLANKTDKAIEVIEPEVIGTQS